MKELRGTEWYGEYATLTDEHNDYMHICNILTSGIAVGVIVHPSYAFIVPVDKEGIVITGFRTEFLYGFGIVLSFIFACNGFFFRR